MAQLKFTISARRKVRNNLTHTILFILSAIEIITITFMYIPAIVKAYRTKDTTSYSTAFWGLLVVALLARTTSSSIGGNLFLISTSAVNLVLAVVMLCLVVYYKKNVEKDD